MAGKRGDERTFDSVICSLEPALYDRVVLSPMPAPTTYIKQYFLLLVMPCFPSFNISKLTCLARAMMVDHDVDCCTAISVAFCRRYKAP